MLSAKFFEELKRVDEPPYIEYPLSEGEVLGASPEKKAITLLFHYLWEKGEDIKGLHDAYMYGKPPYIVVVGQLEDEVSLFVGRYVDSITVRVLFHGQMTASFSTPGELTKAYMDIMGLARI